MGADPSAQPPVLRQTACDGRLVCRPYVVASRSAHCFRDGLGCHNAARRNSRKRRGAFAAGCAEVAVRVAGASLERDESIKMESPQQAQKPNRADEVRLLATPVRPPEPASTLNSIQIQIAPAVPLATETPLPATPNEAPVSTSAPPPPPVREMSAPDEMERSSIPVLPRVVIVGCSGHARVVVDILEQENRCHIVGLLDSVKPPGTEVLGYQVIGSDEDLPALVAGQICDGIIVAIGDNWVRSRMVARIKKMLPEIRFITAMHPSAQIAMSSSVGPGDGNHGGSGGESGMSRGRIVHSEYRIIARSRFPDGRFFQSCAACGNRRRSAHRRLLSDRDWRDCVALDPHWRHYTVIGAGATVLRDIPDRVVAYGSPAKIIRSRKPGDPYLGEPALQISESDEFPYDSPVLQSLALIPSQIRNGRCIPADAVHDFFHTAEYHRVAECLGAVWLARRLRNSGKIRGVAVYLAGYRRI